MTHKVDTLVGKRIRQARWLKELTQSDLATAVDIKFQQIQKYETGANRVSASRLSMIAKTLDRPISYFFDETERPEDQISRDEAQLVAAYRAAKPAVRQLMRDVGAVNGS